MDSNNFNRNIEARIESCKATLIKKAGEYATDGDRLHNFQVAAKLQGITPREALGGMMAKHTVSVYDLIRQPELASPEMWTEKLGDHLNYLLLLSALVEEEQNQLDFEKDVPAEANEELKVRPFVYPTGWYRKGISKVWLEDQDSITYLTGKGYEFDTLQEGRPSF